MSRKRTGWLLLLLGVFSIPPILSYLNSFIADFIFAFVCSPLSTYLWAGKLGYARWSTRFYKIWMNTAIITAVILLILSRDSHGLISGNAASAGVAFVLWLWSRRKRLRKALKTAGDKSMARLRDIVRRMPKGALRPLPGPA